ncbi:MAG: S1 family peptidase [Planctomycetota bacterium]|jgi:S1-C subfamily serine protease
MKPMHLVATFTAALFVGCSQAPPIASDSPDLCADVPSTDDGRLIRALEEAAARLVKAGKPAPPKNLIKQLSRGQCSLSLPAVGDRKLTPAEIYATCRKSVLVLAMVHKCQRCPRHHVSIASAFLITADGAFVTNYHVVANAAGKLAMIAMTDAGDVYPVAEVLAADEDDDVAILRLAAPGVRFSPLALSTEAPVGSPVGVISHPDRRLYSFTHGVVSRYVRSRVGNSVVTRLCITADYARGSSGGPVIGQTGAAVGHADSTRSIYYKVSRGKKENLQMVIKQCVPAASTLALIERR